MHIEKQSSPLNQIISLSFGHLATKCGMLAAELNLHNIVTDKPQKIEEIAKILNLKLVGTKKFFRALSAFNLIKFDDEYIMASELTPYLDHFLGTHIIDGYKAIDELRYSLEQDEPCWDKVYHLSFYEYLKQHPEKFSQFETWCKQTAKVWLTSILKIYDFKKFDTIVDVGGGHGDLLKKILEANPSSNGILFDLPLVIKETKVSPEHIAYQDKIKYIGGDFFVEVPSGGDLYIICRTLLNWNNKKAIEIINNCHKAMLPGKKLVILDFIVPESSHPSYQRAALSDLNLYALMNSSNRTKEEWLDLLSNTYFTSFSCSELDPVEQNDLVMPIGIIEATKI